MAVTVTDNRTLIDEADLTTGWTGSVSPSPFTSEPSPVEFDTHLGQVISKTSGWLYHTHGSNIDGSGTGILVYVWVLSKGSPLPKASGGIGIVIGDGADLIGYHLAGGDEAGFRHNVGQPYYQCLLIDTSKLAAFTNKKIWVGTDTLVMTTLTDFGSEWDVGTAKAVGGVANCFTDAVRVGNGGLTITAGGSGTEGKFSEIAADDADAATTGKAYGIIRELSSGLYGVQGPLQFGDSAETADVYFEDDGAVVVFEAREIGNDKYRIDVEGASAYTNNFVLENSTVKSAGPYVTCNFAGGNVNTLTLTSVLFQDLVNSITFSNLADASGHEVDQCSFVNCGQIDPGDVDFSNNLISSTSASTTGGLLLDADAQGTSNLSNLSFISGGTGHAIYIPSGATGTYTLSGFSYSDYGSTGTTDAAVYNNSGGAVTLQINGGDSPTYYNGTSATTTIINTKTLTVNVKDSNAIAIPYAKVRIENSSTQTLITDGIANNLGVFTYSSYNYTGDEDVNIIVRKNSPGELRYLPAKQPATIGSTGLIITVAMTLDSSAGLVPSTGILRHGVTSEDESGNAVITSDIDLPAGTNRKLVIGGFYWDSASGLTAITITYDGNAMNLEALASISEQEGAGNWHEVFFYRYDISDSDSGRKTISVTYSSNIAIKGIAFAVIDDVASGGANSASSNTGDQVTTNPSVTLNNSAAAWSVVFLMVDDIDSPSATGVASIRRSNLVVDELKMMAILVTDRTTTGSHSLGADYGANSKTWVAGGAAFLKN